MDGGGAGAGELSEKYSKQINDLEAHLNTSIITEKSVRKAQDKYLAEEIDRFTKQMVVIQDKIKLQLDEEGNVLAEKTKQESQIKLLNENMTAVMDQAETLKLELNDLKEGIARGDVGSSGVNEETTAQINKLNTKVTELEEASAKYANDIKALGPKANADDEYITYATVDQVDGKMAALLEKLKNDNQLIWKETVSLAEKQFSSKGIQDTMELMPSTLQGLKQLKSTINILDAGFEGDTNKNQPRPNINGK